MKTVVQFMGFASIYNDNLQQNLRNNETFCKDFTLDALCLEDERRIFEKGKAYPPKWNVLGRLCYWINFNAYLIKKKHFDKKSTIVNIQFVDFKYVLLLPYIKKNFGKIVLSFWGSDLLRQKHWRLQFLKVLFDIADRITFETDEMIAIFQGKVGNKYNDKIRKANFGSSVMERQNKLTEQEILNFAEKYGINRNKRCIVIGYNRNEAHQHYEVIRSLIDSNINKDDFFVIIPWTYGPESKEYRDRLESQLRGNFEYTFLETFMERDEIACLRACTDVLFQVQITDSLSATMLETLYGKKEVITGNWLPYKELVDAGITMSFVDKVSDAGKALEKITKTPAAQAELEKNKEIIWSRYSWEASINKWISLYQ